MRSFMHNPLLPEEHFVPDAEAHVFGGRLYLYGSYDICGRPGYCSEEYRVFSTDDMITWVDHGVSFRLSDAAWYTGGGALYAPDCVCRDGVYYLYYCVPDGRCGVARADRPEGPFTDIGQIAGVSGIDPAVLIDDDGQAYLYWGQFDGVRAAKLRESMTEIYPDSVVQPLSVAEHDFHEGSSVKKIDGKYYFLYTDTHRHKSPAHSYGMATCLGYAVSDSPTSGFKYGGVVIDNLGCDPGTWNDHGSICEFKGQWYVFYHRSTHGFEFSRHVCAEPITISDGVIREVGMTASVGERPGASIPAGAFIRGSWACGLTGHARVTDGNAPVTLMLGGILPGDTALYRYIDFDGEDELCLSLSCGGACVLVVEAGGARVYDGPVPADGVIRLSSPLVGCLPVVLTFGGGFGEASLEGMTFKKD